ncbi:probable nucleolar complex protein 14 [[Candida] jaroonii]|uniref:Probable nucleolar complex protein 14 n=1 Tax=[Candida] jaroonii TaxID=467808 RepID=A0ACA9Y2Q0_9ASCO|nr:probable nucleolar complex protein 14 [[Candida] jaroonii]
MAGSQLKKLKAELKSQGLIGQTNIKNKKRPADRDKTKEKLGEIREKFNVFDNKVNRVKRDVTTIEHGKFVTIGKGNVKNTSKTNSFLNKNLKLAYEAHKSRKGRNGKIIDKRFGENSNLGDEDKMLERFIKEREQSSKSKFSLESDDEYDDDEGDFQLTHSGKLLPEDMEEPQEVQEEDLEPARKKTKKEVMAEIIAKSKKYKQERQKLHSQTQQEIDELDDEFQDIMGEFNSKPSANNAFSTKKPEEIEYDNKVRELVYDKRSVPADKTKTDEEKRTEYEEKMKKLEQDRLTRMEGEREAQGDDLDFWESEEEDDQEENKQDLQEEEDEESYEEVEFEDYDTFDTQVSEKGISFINNIIKNYKPHLREGNKARMNKFVSNLFKYLCHSPQNDLIPVLKKLCESYNETLVQTMRDEMLLIQERIETNQLEKSDLIFFVICGFLFSTSDKYHLIVIPNLILMNEVVLNYKHDGIVVFMMDLLLQYQRISKRFIPEINFIIKDLLTKYQKIELKDEEDLMSVDEIFQTNTESKLVNKLFTIIDKVNSQYKDYSILKNLNQSILPLLHNFGNPTKKLTTLIEKLTKINSNIKLIPLKLQSHKQLAIKTFQPKYEENFNPNKVYDNLEQSEVNKLKKLVKRETKNQMKDFRKQNRFEAQEKLKEKVKMYDDYHKKMANIVNSISTIEGKEKNDYAKEKRRRKQ